MPRILYLLSGGCGAPYYRIELTTGSSGTMTSTVTPSRVDEEDLRRIISERITVGCYRAADETRAGCPGGLSSITWNGRELVKPAK